MANKLLSRLSSFLILVGIIAFLFIKGSAYIGIGLAITLLVALFEWYKINQSRSSMIYILGNVYIAFPIVCWLFDLFKVNGPLHEDMAFEFLIILGIASCSDTFAYIGGSTLGGPKIFPKISPSKTWSGTICGIVVPVILSYVIFDHHIARTAITGILAMFGVLGDLVESKAKRVLGVKDTGTIIPGHGGILDRLDSFIMVSYVYFFLRLCFSFYYTVDL
jgi:phosphatidate cytidylyltransferase